VACVDVILGGTAGNGDQAGKLLRDAGFKGKFVVVSVEPSCRTQVAKTLGTSLSLQKPFDRTRLLKALAMALQVCPDEKLDPILSDLEDAEQSRELLEMYVKQAQMASIQIQRLIEADDFNAVRLQCQTLRGTAAGYGFAPLADAAAKAVTALDTGCVISEAEAELQILQAICHRISADRPA
jgi:HPt (histidine-containing phosphotransfer) domain-containing protein